MSQKDITGGEDQKNKEDANQAITEEEFNALYDAAINNQWKMVAEKYKNNCEVLRVKLTKSQETALHMAAVASYDTQKAGPRAACLDDVKAIVNSIPEEKLEKVLGAKNVMGNTPLHLAAKLGNEPVCKCIGDRSGKLIANRNDDGETPLFLAAHHNHMNAFFQLLDIYKKYCKIEATANRESPEPVEGLCRRRDGNTILHSAVSGEYYHSADRIINEFGDLVSSNNVDGETPLAILARKPNSFESTSRLGFLDYIIYHSLDVLNIKLETPQKEETGRRYPENYATLAAFCGLIGRLMKKSIGILGYCRNHDSSDEENGNKNKGILGYCRNRNPSDEENGNKNKVAEKEKDDHKFKDDHRFPSTYATLINIFKLLLVFSLVILGIGYHKIKKLLKMKKRHKWAKRIMDKMVESGTNFKYLSDGQTRPTQEALPNRFIPPLVPPTDYSIDEHHPFFGQTSMDDHNLSSNESKQKNETGKDNEGSAEQPKHTPEVKLLAAAREMVEGILDKLQLQISASEEKDKNVLLLNTSSTGAREKTQETPFLIAAKMGITEMVAKIMQTFPMAIHDLDANGKNVLLLAIEYRHTQVFDYLLEGDGLQAFVFNQVDKEGNSARHVAGLRGPANPWALPGTALQMHGESSWFKYVHDKLPDVHYAQYNKKGKTPRDVFREEHEELSKNGAEWLIKTSESCSVVAALIATVAFATSVSVPGGNDDKSGRPLLEDHPVFHLFSVSSLVALCFSLTSLIFFLAIITSRCQVWDFEKNLPRRLLMGLSCLLTSIAAILVSFCAGHFFVLSKDLEFAAVPIYTVTSVPLTIFAFSNVRLYKDLLGAVFTKVPSRSY